MHITVKGWNPHPRSVSDIYVCIYIYICIYYVYMHINV